MGGTERVVVPAKDKPLHLLWSTVSEELGPEVGESGEPSNGLGAVDVAEVDGDRPGLLVLGRGPAEAAAGDGSLGEAGLNRKHIIFLKIKVFFGVRGSLTANHASRLNDFIWFTYTGLYVEWLI